MPTDPLEYAAPTDPGDPRSDEAIIAAINAGGPEAPRHFETLYRRHRAFVHAVALRYAASPEDALDVTQEVFIYLLGKFPGLALTSKLTTFLYPAAKHIALARKRRRVPRPVDAAALDALRVPEAPAARPDLHDLAAVLRDLSEVHREAIVMRFADGMSMEEMSAALGIPVGTVKSRLHNAVAALRADPRVRAYFLGE